MTDRELLEKAASAAYYHYDADEGICGTLYLDKYARRQHDWNPLENDADAFRLMVDADLVVAVAHGEILATHDEITAISGPLGGDPYATTRRAIVRAAANKGDAQ